MTVIGEHMFATGDDNGIVKGKLYLYHFFLLFHFIESIVLIFKYGIFEIQKNYLYLH